MLFDPAPIDYATHQVVFVHIPKTGGSALADALEQRFGPDGHLRTRMQKLEKVWDSPLAAWAWRADQAMRHAIVAARGSHYLIQRGTPRSAVDRAALISGHFALGDEPPSAKRPVYVSLLRDPVDRFVSHFYYLRDLRDQEGSPPARETTLARLHDLDAYVDLLASGRTIGISNIQCRYIGGTERFEDARRAVDERVFLAAPADRIDDFLQLAAPAFGIEAVGAERVNVGQRRGEAAAAAAETLVKIRRLFADDVALFDYVSQGFEAVYARYAKAVRSSSQV